MPRSGSGIYTQPFPNVIEDTTIESAVYNGFTRDVEADLNLPRPVVAGGTGATSPAGALDNLGALPLTGGSLTGALEITEGDLTLNAGSITATDDNAILTLAKKLSGQVSAVVGRLLANNRWRLLLGNATAETGANTGSDFALERYDDAGVLLGTPMTISRRLGTVSVAGAPDAHVPILAINKTLNGTAASLQGQYNGLARWGFSFGDGGVEIGGNSGSDFRVNRYSDTGVFIDVPFGIFRSTGQAFFSGAPPDQNPVMVINKISGSGLQSSMIQGRVANINRWGLALGDGSSELGGNSGSNFKVNRYDDSGNFLNFSIYVGRADNTFAVTGAALKPGGGSWGDTSDARIKTVTGEYEQGLEAVRQLRPVTYKYRGNDITSTPDKLERVSRGQPSPESTHYTVAKEGREFVGLVAQQVEQAMPEMVTHVSGMVDGHKVSDLRVMDTSALTYALVNSVKELAARVEALESLPSSSSGAARR